MTSIGWLADDPGYVGGAELTQAEFRAAAPEGVQIIDCPPGEVEPDLDAYAVNNCVHYSEAEIRSLSGNVVKYIHDVWPATQGRSRDWLLEHARLIFCSPLHRERFPHEIPDWAVTDVIPPALDLDRLKPNRQVRRNTERKGTCTVAGWRNPGKGAQAIEEWAAENGPVDCYGGGEFGPGGPHVTNCGEVPYAKVPEILWGYERFVFLPTALEPFCRTVVEAHFAGCEIVTNGRIGARYWLEEKPEALRTAAEDFWAIVLS